MAAVSKAATTRKGVAACCYQEPDTCCAVCGRALRDGDTLVSTASAARGDWLAARSLDFAPNATLGERFAAMAGAEHASIASFARTTLDLLALGAPPDLVADTQRAALDEIAHARTMYSLAAAALGTTLGPAPLAPVAHAPPTLADFAAATLRDACAGETLGVVVLRELAATLEGDAALALAAIADDEERHAELAFRTLAWAVARGGESARQAVRAELDRVPRDAWGVCEGVVAPCVLRLLAA